MAQMIPDDRKGRVVFVSRAEEVFYNICREKLGRAWQVYYSRTLSALDARHGLQENEIDFVLYHPRFGVVVVEVKGGRIRYEKESNNFFSVNRHGQSFAIKSPFQQALVWRSRLVRILKDKRIRVPVSHAVCLPSIDEAEFPRISGIEPSIILGRHALEDLERSLKNLVRKSHPERFLKFEDVAKPIEGLLAGADFCTKLYLKDYIETHESKVKDVEGLHDTLVAPVATARRLGVEGEAGTGKTVLAMNLARHFRDQGQRVLLLSSNDVLNLHLEKQAGERVSVMTYAEVASRFDINLLSPPDDYEGSRQDWVQLDAPDRLRMAVEESDFRFDVVLCDEAQDVQPFWWDVIEKLVDPDAKHSRLYIFFDRSQGVFGSGGESAFIPERVLPVEAPYFTLVNNYRTTVEIATFARAFRTGKQILESHSTRLGYLPQIVTYKDHDEARLKLNQLMGKLIQEEKLAPNDIALLSARKPNVEPSVLSGLDHLGGVPLHFLSGRKGKVLPDAEETLVSTVSSFKGLETKVGIMINFSEYNMPLTNPIMASLAYVALTRAKHMLYVFVKEGSPKHRAFQSALKNIRLTGRVVVGDEISDYELTGNIKHYNPERVGWIEVEDPHFQQGDVMFFPFDVGASELGEVKVGDKITFRPRLEGKLTIACEMKKIS